MAATFDASPPRRLPLAVVAGLTLLAGSLWAALEVAFLDARLQSLRLPAFDTAYFQQLVWGLFHGHPFHASFLQGNFLGLHFSPLLVLPALVELALPGAAGLNLVSAVALGAVAPTCFMACREILPRGAAGTGLAGVIAVAVLVSPPMQEVAWSGFHTEELALPLLLLATWSVLRGQRVVTVALLLAVLLAKEDEAYQVAVLGALLMVSGRPRAGRWALGTAMVWLVVVVAVVMPWIRAGAPADTGNYYAWLVSGGVAATISAGRLVEVLRALTAFEAWRLVALTAFALSLLPLLRPRFALLVLPPVLAAVLSRHQPQPHLQLQYALPIVYPMVIAAALGGRRLLEGRQGRRGLVAAALIPALAAALAGTLLTPMATLLTHRGPQHLGGLAAAMVVVPAGAEVDSDDSLAAAVASRAELHLLPHVTPAAFVLVDTAARPPRYTDTAARDGVVAALGSARRVLWSDGRIQLWSPVP